MNLPRLIYLSLVALVLVGCSRGAVKGPVGQGEKGLGLSIPVLSLFDRDTYEADKFSPENLDSTEVNPFRGDIRDTPPERDSFTRYREEGEW